MNRRYHIIFSGVPALALCAAFTLAGCAKEKEKPAAPVELDVPQKRIQMRALTDTNHARAMGV